MRSDIVPGGVFLPHTLVLKPGLVIHSIYKNKWGRDRIAAELQRAAS